MEDKKKRGTWKTADNMSDEEAAKVIQGLFRSRKAKKMIRDLVSLKVLCLLECPWEEYVARLKSWLSFFLITSSPLRQDFDPIPKSH